MEDLPAFLRRASDRCGFSRDIFKDSDLPTNPEDIMVVHLFPDVRSEFILSSLLLPRIKDKTRKYLILCSWKGHAALFPYASEYWSPKDALSQDQLRRGTRGLHNDSADYAIQQQNLNFFFKDVLVPRHLDELYRDGLTIPYWRNPATRFLPMIPSPTYLGLAFNREIMNKPGIKVMVMPVRYGRKWHGGKVEQFRTLPAFWSACLNRLIREGYCPVVLQNHMTYDLSPEFPDRAIFVHEEEIDKVLGMMRTTGLVLDIFSGVSRWAVAARTPFIAVDERSRYATEKEYEIDDLCADTLPKHYIFGFATMLEDGDPGTWNGSIFDNVVAKLKTFETINRDSLPSTLESYTEVLPTVVRERKAKRIGTRFVKIPRD